MLDCGVFWVFGGPQGALERSWAWLGRHRRPESSMKNACRALPFAFLSKSNRIAHGMLNCGVFWVFGGPQGALERSWAWLGRHRRPESSMKNACRALPFAFLSKSNRIVHGMLDCGVFWVFGGPQGALERSWV